MTRDIMRALVCSRCGSRIALVENRLRRLIASSTCEPCSHPAYYDGRTT